MAIVPQDYPRTTTGFLDVEKVAPHTRRISFDEVKAIIREAVEKAGRKSSRAILDVPDDISDADKLKLFQKKGKMLFAYFRRYYGDPATTAYDCFGQHFSDVAKEQFRNQTLQKERMNSGWRYQFIAKDCAVKSRRFTTVSDIGAAEADFNATMKILETGRTLNIYVSIKNRINTMGGQDWPKAIYALEDVARGDKNRGGPYICVFGIVIEKGQRSIKGSAKTKSAYSVNTEVWLSDFFWPFFSNYSYSEIAKAVLEVLMEGKQVGVPPPATIIPSELIEAFGEECRGHGLLDKQGRFNNPLKLIDVFCDTKEHEMGISNNQ
jgi:hypothetical protein